MLPIVPANVAPVVYGLAVTSWVSPGLRLTPFELTFAFLEFVFCLVIVAARVEDPKRHAPTTTDRHLPKAA